MPAFARCTSSPGRFAHAFVFENETWFNTAVTSTIVMAAYQKAGLDAFSPATDMEMPWMEINTAVGMESGQRNTRLPQVV